MGQAKRRGTFEARKAEAIIRNKEDDRKREEWLAERERRKTPKQRAEEARAKAGLTAILGLSGYYDYQNYFRMR